MKRSRSAPVTVSIALLPVLTLAIAAPAQAGICPAQLADGIATEQAKFDRSRWGISIQTFDGESLYAQESDRFFIPASNVKLLTTAAALTQLGADYRIRTSVYQSEDLLRVVGRGDPSVGDDQLLQLATQLRDRGIRRIDSMILDESTFAAEPINPSWEAGDLPYGYAAPVSSFIVNENAVTLRLIPQAIGDPLRLEWNNEFGAVLFNLIENQSFTVAATEPEFIQVDRQRIRGQLQVDSPADETSLSVPEPSLYFLDRWQIALRSVGISLPEGVGLADRWLSPPDNEIEIAAIDSPPLSQLLIPTNQESNNLYAESLLRQVGIAAQPETDSPLQAGIAAIESTLSQIGVDPEGFDLADGSGLSRHNLVTPEAIVQTLQAMSDSTVYRNSLAVAGESGTLVNRFQGTIAQGRLQGKTGAISGVAALSGYLNPPNYEPIAFSILVNHFDVPVREVRPSVDAIVLQLAQLEACDD
ncbi:D-alanyl-D-alanine carboxypeptidase/D-alanyl-D-alanine-endopeptidase [Microcoleus sp. FACHB-1515]|uniref:D-alanyl-D-alanine carboxypeptidase/D-alanyl-D-alanine endopeptidase n=1 Tax=Cyanophyceae TaxID=3028117 RepID=UPI00168243B6|nr:D-alanyl-D-alanine carboxypeptidase/D-alanyl-D-alanine-endopeptidase [Microcoleus sp. FACHB-1515]MBD2090119.1 D-alanyl-D-alanine carboxypeptidase/D-alanyl-D-alanine-endopeptidase [Microcoleus sp. FACHB-1515]